MSQRVDYEPLPSTRYDQYIFKLRNVLSALQSGSMNFKSFRDFLRKQGIWEKDRSAGMLSLVDISWDKREVKVGKVAKRLMATHSDSDFQDVLFERLKEVNILLVKYVLEALDVESGGRLHSVHELYRLITSYVYPGEYITLTNFQAWIDWLAATGYIKLVGIRWALGDKGLKIVGELRAMDIEEILEDMEEEDEEEDDDDAADDDADDAGGGGFGDGDFGGADFDDEEDLFADLPPEPDPPSADTIRAAEQAFEESFDDVPGTDAALTQVGRGRGRSQAAPARSALPSRGEAAPMVLAPGALHAPMVSPGWGKVATVSLEDADTAALAARIGGWYQALSAWPSFTAERLGVVREAAASDLALFVELGVLASLIEGLAPQPQVFAFVSRLRQTTFFATLGHGEGLEEGLDAMERTGAEPWARALFERLVHARFIARRVSMKIDLLPALRGAEDGATAIALLREHVLGPHWVEAPFWVARELVRLEVVDTEALRSVAAVPSARLRANAARIGLLPSAEVHDFQSLLALSQQVAGLFGEEAGFGEALEVLDRALGLTP